MVGLLMQIIVILKNSCEACIYKKTSSSFRASLGPPKDEVSRFTEYGTYLNDKKNIDINLTNQPFNPMPINNNQSGILWSQIALFPRKNGGFGAIAMIVKK